MRFKNLAMAWLRKQWNEPSRSDYYLMRIAQRVQQQYSLRPISIEDQRVSHNFTTAAQSRKDRIARSKSVWIGGVKAAKEQRRGNRT